MSVIKLASFTGEAPRLAPRLLPETGAQIAQSVRLEDGELGPYRIPYFIQALAGAVAGTVKTIYRFGTTWLSWTTVVNAVPGPVATDRLYYTGDGAPKMRVGTDIYTLAIPAPNAALVATPVGATGAIYDTRLYVFTYVTSFGEETEPSPVSNEVNVSVGQVVTLSGFPAVPAGRGITLQRIYRSQTGLSGGTQLYFIAERAAGTGNYSDSIATADFAEALPSADWTPPPAGLSGLISIPNGMMAGFLGKDLYICEPYQPHAFPEKYVLTADHNIVGLAAYGNTIVVATDGLLYFVTGSAPESMVMEKTELNMPCMSTRGMVDLGYAAAFPSNDGLVMAQGGSASVVTAGLMTRDQWQAIVPSTLVCGQFYGRYFASYAYTDSSGMAQAGMLILDLTGQAPFIVRSQHRAEAFFYDLGTSTLFICIGDSVYQWDSTLAINDTFTWKSKVFLSERPCNFGAILVELDPRDNNQAISASARVAAIAAVTAANATIFAAKYSLGDLGGGALGTYALAGDSFGFMPPPAQVSVNVYADNELRATVTTIDEMARLPGGRLSREWVVEVNGSIPVQAITLAGTARELCEAQ